MAGDDSTVVTPVSTFSAGNYESGGFNYHVVVEQNNLRYDAAASYLYSNTGSAWQNPVYEWSASTYWQRGTHPHFGFVYSRFLPFEFLVTPLGQFSVNVSEATSLTILPTGLS